MAFKKVLEVQKNELCGNKCQEHNYVQFLELLEYFKKTYLINYETENWNYYDSIKHITNNASESFNKYFKKLFAKKPTFFQLLSELQEKEFKYYIDYERRTALVKYYKDMEMISLNYEMTENRLSEFCGT
ncbi:hypothetical protein U3516DRAFT_764595 [Neocallimastix sp. 'constans']